MPTLDWTGKQDALKAAQKVPYRLLEFDSDNSCGEGDNLIVQGDNLEALKSLNPDASLPVELPETTDVVPPEASKDSDL